MTTKHSEHSEHAAATVTPAPAKTEAKTEPKAEPKIPPPVPEPTFQPTDLRTGSEVAQSVIDDHAEFLQTPPNTP